MTASPKRSWMGQLRLNWDYRRDLATNPRFSPSEGLYEPQELETPCTCGANHAVGDVDWSGITQPITFTYRAGTAGMGNSLLRGFQVADMLVTLGAPVPVRVQALENLYRAGPQKHTIIALKTAVRMKSLPILKKFVRSRNTLLFDVIDGLVPPTIGELATGFICGSVTEFQTRVSRGAQAILSLQSPDQRTPLFDFTRRDFRTVYYGLAENALHLDQLDNVTAVDFVDMPPHGSSDPLPKVFDDLGAYSHHYSVRAWNDRDGFKPMMKGFFAARLGAIAIASSEDEESRLILGPDYPYLSASSALPDVQDTIEFARQTQLGPEWERAVSTMTRLREMSCPVATAKSLIAGLRELRV